jgi:hypothetical protein
MKYQIVLMEAPRLSSQDLIWLPGRYNSEIGTYDSFADALKGVN